MKSSPPFIPTRTTWIKLHVYLALTLGLVFALIGLTGSLSVAGPTLDLWLNPQLEVEKPDARHLPMEQILRAVQKAHPELRGAWTLEMPLTPNGTITAWYESPPQTFGKLYAPLMVSVNPYTAEVAASRLWGDTAATWLLDMHTQLGLDRFGWRLVGLMGILLTASIGSGLYLWWPGFKDLRGALTVRADAGLICLAQDLHRVIGWSAAIVLLLLALTGFNLAYPGLLETLTGSPGMSHGAEGPSIRSSAVPNDHPINLSEALLIARGPFPRAEVRRITTPDGVDGSYRINLRQLTEVNHRHPYTTVWVDRWSGQIREVSNPSRFSGGQSLLTWIWPLHTGEAFGPVGRLLWFIAGLTPAALYISGMLSWLHRRGAIRDRPVNLSTAPLRRAAEKLAAISAHWIEKLRPVVSAELGRLTQFAARHGRRLWLRILRRG